jgi:hypothetical protein
MSAKRTYIRLVLSLILFSALMIYSPTPLKETVRTEASAQFAGMNDRSLPYVAHWNLGEVKGGFSPEYQMKLVDQGEYLLPWFLMPNEFADPEDPHWQEYYEAAIKRAAQLNLPISLISTQWEIILSTTDEYLNLPPDQNPNVVTADGQVRREVSPFGPVNVWKEAGMKWGSSRMMKKLQEWYPNPPMVLFVSNNEHVKLEWMKAEEDCRFARLFGRGRDDDFKRKVVGDGWIERYRALQQGIREGLASDEWREKAVFIGYDAFGPSHFARWAGWMEHSLYSSGRVAPWPYAWDGASTPFYVFNWSSITDYTVFSPQIEAMNWVFMLEETRRFNSKFWFEISTWDGHEQGDIDKHKAYERAGQEFTPDRYAGMVQFGMWLLRPRVVREFRGYRDTVAQSEAYFLPITDAVYRVHKNSTLNEFWRRGELVPNRMQSHPYQTLVPAEYQNVDRWFLLETSLDPPRPWELGTQLPVFALALVKGKAPQRQWLVYAHSPLGDRQGVQVSIPGYRSVTMNVTVAGTYYLVDEKYMRAFPVH